MVYSLPTVSDLPPIDRLALLLDIDGTLLDFAATPEAVIIPPELRDCLRRLKKRLGGAIGFITGRSIEQVDLMLPDIATAVASEHGAAIRHTPEAEMVRHAPATVPESWLKQAEEIHAAHPGSVLEHKSAGFVLHYRQIPEAGQPFHIFMQTLVNENPLFCVLSSSMAWELKACGVDKGLALRNIMQHRPFSGRLPVFIGDDVTDHDAIQAAQLAGGRGFLVKDAFGGPADVREWLFELTDTVCGKAG